MNGPQLPLAEWSNPLSANGLPQLPLAEWSNPLTANGLPPDAFKLRAERTSSIAISLPLSYSYIALKEIRGVVGGCLSVGDQ